jgi:U3 small nucleolar RNA-associated protein 4
MDIHRVRFIPYPASAINALAFTPWNKSARNQRSCDVRLAIGRANGDIEIWNPLKGGWVQETIFRGGKDRSVEGLAWIQEPDEQLADGKVTPGRYRLFSIGYSNTVTEWDLKSGLPLRHSSGNYTEVWCLAAQPQSDQGDKQLVQNDVTRASRGPEFIGQNLVAGCADGTIVILSTADDDVKFLRYLARPTTKKSRTLSVAFQNRNTVVAGFADSSIRVYDVTKGTLIRTMSLGAGPKGSPSDTLVWTVRCLPNGNIVSGDSAGQVTFWDGRTYTQLQRLSGHEADILDLAVSEDGHTVFSAGMDRRTVVYRLGKGKPARWAKISQKRYHQHDVKAMAVFESKKMSVVVSGGTFYNPILWKVL